MVSNAHAQWRRRFACLVACLVISLLLPSCATAPSAASDAVCKQESCLFPVLMDLSMPEAQK